MTPLPLDDWRFRALQYGLWFLLAWSNVLVGAYVLRLAVALNNAANGNEAGPILPRWAAGVVDSLVARLNATLRIAADGDGPPSRVVPVPHHGKALAIVLIPILFNALVTWAYLDSFEPKPQRGRPVEREGFEEEQEEVGTAPAPQAMTSEQLVKRAIVCVRAFLWAFALLIVVRLLLPADPWRAFLITGNFWLILAGMYASLFVVFGLAKYLPQHGS